MALFESQVERMTDYLERLSSRDRVLLVVVIVGVVLLVGFLFSVLVGGKRRSLEANNRDLAKKLGQIMQMQGQFEQARRKVRALERQIKRNGNVQLVPFLDRLSKKNNLNITSMNPAVIEEGAKKADSRIRERAVKIRIQAAPLHNLAKFLQDIERSGKVVKVRSLRLTPNFSERTKPDIQAVIATYSLES